MNSLQPNSNFDNYGNYGSSHSSSSHSHHRHSRRRRRRRLLLITLPLAFILTVATSAVAFASLINQGRDNLLALHDAEIQTQGDAQSYDQGRTVSYQGHNYRLNENIVSICIIGEDKEARAPEQGFNGQADAIMVLAIDTKSGKITGIGIPRDSMVEVNRNYSSSDKFYDTQTMQICLAYSYGANDASSSELVCTAASRILYNVPIDYYYTMSLSGLGALADAVGGVALEPIESIPGTNIVKGETIKLTGDNVEKYVRWRNTNQYGTAVDRAERQQQFVKALISKVLATAQGSPSVIMDLYNTISSYAVTNLGPSELSYLASRVLATGQTSMDVVRLQGEPVHNDQSEWEQYILDKDAVYQTVLDVYYESAGSSFYAPSEEPV